MGRRGHGSPPGLRQNPPGPGRYHSTLPHLPSPRPGRWTPPLSLTSASTVAMAGAPERSPAPPAAPRALAPPLAPHSSQWRRSAGNGARARQHGGPLGAAVRTASWRRPSGGAVQPCMGMRWHGDRAGMGTDPALPARAPTDRGSSLIPPRSPSAQHTPRPRGEEQPLFPTERTMSFPNFQQHPAAELAHNPT